VWYLAKLNAKKYHEPIFCAIPLTKELERNPFNQKEKKNTKTKENRKSYSRLAQA